MAAKEGEVKNKLPGSISESPKLRAEEIIYLHYITGMNAFKVAEHPDPHLKFPSSKCTQSFKEEDGPKS